LQDTSFFNINRNQTLTTNQRHAFNIKLSSQIDSLTLIEFKPSFSYDIGKTVNSDTTTFEGETNIQSLITSINSTNNSKGLTMNGTGRIYRKFMKKRRELEVRYDLNMNRNNTNSSLYTKNDYKFFVDSVSTIDQRKTNQNAATSHYGTISYFEPLSKKWKVNFTYLFEYGYSNQDKITLNRVGNAYTDTAANFSNIFDNTRMQHRGGTEFIYESGKHFLSGGAFVRNIQIDNINRITDLTINQNITNVLPRFKYEFKPSMSKRFSVNYTTSSQQPSINDVQPVQDNSNPNRLIIGNSDLKPNYVHNVMVNFNQWNALSGKYIWSGGSLNLVNNAFATRTSYDAYGRSTAMTVNVDGNFSAFVWAGAGFPILDRKIEFNPQLNGSLNRYKSLIEESGVVRVNTTDNYAVTPEMQIEVQLDSLEISLNGSYSFNKPINSLSTTSTTPFGVQKYGMDLTWRLPKGFSIDLEGNYTKNNGLINTEFFILNAEFSKKFLATQNLIVSIRGNDLLNQNISAQRTVSGNAITDYRTTIISRYFLLKVTLRFNNRKAKEDDFKGWH
jgi:YD repeat-containing protein